MNLIIVRDEDIYELRNGETDEVIFRSDEFKTVQRMYHEMQLREATSKINQALRGR